MALTIALLVFIAIVVLVVGLWWVAQAERSVRARLKRPSRPDGPAQILRTDAERDEGPLGNLLGSTGLMERLGDLVTQSGYKRTPSDIVLIILAFCIVNGAAGWLRTSTFF